MSDDQRHDQPPTARGIADPSRPVQTTPAGRRWQLLRGEADETELEVLAAALDRLATIEAGGQPSPWVTAWRPGAGVRAWAPGVRWSHSQRSLWGRIP